jgi:hypothetical protein
MPSVENTSPDPALSPPIAQHDGTELELSAHDAE